MEFEAVSLASIKFILLPDQQEMYSSSHVLNRQSSKTVSSVLGRIALQLFAVIALSA